VSASFRLDRLSDDGTMTRGVITLPGDVLGLATVTSPLPTLELPWRNNAPDVSCIPAGTYGVALAWSKKFARLTPHLFGVPGRSYIEIHPGNWTENTAGCILPGTVATSTGVGNSRIAFGQIVGWLGLAAREGDVSIVVSAAPQQSAPMLPPEIA
jgi:hypothetical protein